MRNFFLDLAVDQIEILCQNVAKKFIETNMMNKGASCSGTKLREEEINLILDKGKT